MDFSKVVAIDGPSGSGKSTIAKILAERLNLLFIDTGAMYRALAVYFNQQAVTPQMTAEIIAALKAVKLSYCPSKSILIEVNGRDFTDLIRTPLASKLASQYSQIPIIRQHLVAFQRQLAQENVCVMEGRDIGTVVFADSFCKIYLTAQEQVRAQRRFEELQGKGEKNLTFDNVLEDVIERDRNDMNRAIAPLRKAEDALLVDASKMTLEEVIDHLEKIVKKKLKEHGIKL